MNIFLLDKDPEVAAKYHCDKHVVKMILESAQMLCSAYQKHFGKDQDLYKIAFPNHPMTIWVGNSLSNFLWLMNLLNNLLMEYTHRYDKIHATKEIHKQLLSKMNNIMDMPEHGFTEPPQCMPDEYKDKDFIKAYRKYYIGEKKKFAKYTNREEPSWL